eukprot:jgi/Galph1/5232/GphlegSOOS_G3879.1
MFPIFVTWKTTRNLVHTNQRTILPLAWTTPFSNPFSFFGKLPPAVALATEHKRRLRRISVKGDGRCLFRAVAKCLAINEGRQLTEQLEVADADALRKEAWKVICVEKRPLFEKSMIIEGNIHNYCRHLLRPDFYGGEPEMLVLSEVFQSPIQVYISDGKGDYRKIVEYGKEFLSKGVKPIRLLYNGVNHYDALTE